MLKNEEGSSLLIVLMVMVVFSVLGLALIGSTLNNSKQISNTNGVIKSTNLSEMGVEYVKLEVTKYIENNSIVALANTKTAIQSLIKTNVDISIDTNNPDSLFRIENLILVESNILDKDGIKIGEELEINFDSRGTSNGIKEKIIETSIILTRMGNQDELYDETTDTVKKFALTENVKYTRVYSEKYVHYKQDLSLRPPSSLTYLNNLIVDGTATLEANTEIIVNKDAHFRGNLKVKTNKPGTGNLGNVCVMGTLYYYGNPADIEVDTTFTNCQSVTKNNGIYAKNVVYRDPNSPQGQLKWLLENMELQTTY
jgi:Tfp pilus assembly protein PilX